MSQGPSLIFDKSALESLNLDEAVLLDNFYRSTITPLFFVECLADLEKAIRSRSTPEQLVGSLALRTPESQSCATAHHTKVLANELARKFDLSQVLERPMVPYGQPMRIAQDASSVPGCGFVKSCLVSLAQARQRFRFITRNHGTEFVTRTSSSRA